MDNARRLPRLLLCTGLAALLAATCGPRGATAVRLLRQEDAAATTATATASDGGAPADAASNGDETPSQLVLPPLPYDYGALEPVISSQIMQLHHDSHEAAYVSRTNSIWPDIAPQDRNLTRLLTQVGTGALPPIQETTLRNHGGGFWNHEFFWKVMAPPGDPRTSRDAVSPALQAAIENAYGSVDNMLDLLKQSGDGVFGSGWAWVCAVGDGGLRLLATPNQDNPLMAMVRSEPCGPILGVDVWEHAYYLQYGPKRGDYTTQWRSLINWSAVSDFYAAAAKGDFSYNL